MYVKLVTSLDMQDSHAGDAIYIQAASYTQYDPIHALNGHNTPGVPYATSNFNDRSSLRIGCRTRSRQQGYKMTEKLSHIRGTEAY